MKVLVTGGAGFIGSHVVRALLEAGHESVVLDDMSSGRRENVPAGAALAVGDVTDAATVRRAMEGCVAVVHLAALVSVPLSVEQPHRTFEANVAGMQAVLEAARELKVAGPVVYASSAAVYGAIEKVCMAEADADSAVPVSPYAASKRLDEVWSCMYREVYGLRTVGLRFFNVYGQGQDPGNPYSGVLSRLVDCLAKGAIFTVFGDGKQTRDFVAVSDVAAVVVRLLESRGEVPPVMNLGSGKAMELLDVIRQVGDVMGKTPQVVHAEARVGDIRRSCADITALKGVLKDWQPLPLGEGLRRWLG